MPSAINSRTTPTVYSSTSPPTVDVGIFTVAKTGVNLKAAGTTAIFTVPILRTFVATGGFILVTAVTSGGAGVQVSLISESGGSRTMVSQSTSNSGTPVANQTCYAIVNATATILSNCTAGNNVQVVISTSHAGSSAVTGTVFVTGYYVA